MSKFKIDFTKSDENGFTLINSYVIQGIIKHIKKGDFTIDTDSEFFPRKYLKTGISPYYDYDTALYSFTVNSRSFSDEFNPIQKMMYRYIVSFNLDEKYIQWFEQFTNYRIVKRSSVLHSGLWQLNCVD